MKVEILYFAAVRELVGRERELLEVPSDVRTVAELAAHLEQLHEPLRGRLGHVRYAVDESFVEPQHALSDGAVVALIPPVAGGSDRPSAAQRVAIVDGRLAFDAVLDLVRHPGAGALATFVGVVRDRNEGREVSALEYSAYATMATREMARIVDEIEAQIPVARLAAHHRVGQLAVGDEAIICAASSPHRQEAFVAGRALIDRIKERVPIWKREKGPDGAYWVGWQDARCSSDHHHRDPGHDED